MIASIEQIRRGAQSYCDRELGAKAEGLGKFLVYFALPTLPVMIDQKIEQAKALGICPEVFQPDGIDIDNLKQRADKAMEKCNKLNVGSFVFNSADIQTLYNYIRNA